MTEGDKPQRPKMPPALSVAAWVVGTCSVAPVLILAGGFLYFGVVKTPAGRFDAPALGALLCSVAVASAGWAVIDGLRRQRRWALLGLRAFLALLFLGSLCGMVLSGAVYVTGLLCCIFAATLLATFGDREWATNFK